MRKLLRSLVSAPKASNNPAMAGAVREASHAGSWYSDDEEHLSLQLDRFLDAVPDAVSCIGPVSAASGSTTVDLPVEGARVIIAPHAGYSYSGKAAAWAYKAVDWKNAKRVFILGPSHHHYLTRCALSACTSYATPFGNLALDTTTIAALHATGEFDTMSQSVDEAEHSIEMHLPLIHKMLLRTFSDYVRLPPIVPILVGNTTPTAERSYAALLQPYLRDPGSIFVVSSDFAHWGARFGYTYYEDGAGGTTSKLRGADGVSGVPIHESVREVDMRCVGVVEEGDAEAWWDVLRRTGNTVCGRHPIGIALAALEDVVREEGGGGGEVGGAQRGRFRFVRYERSSLVESVRDSSVSYASGFAVV